MTWRWLFRQDDLAEGCVDLGNVDFGVETGAIRPIIEDTDHRQGVAVLDAGGEVALAGHGQHELWSLLHDDLAGQGAAGGHGDVDPVLAADVHKSLDVATATLQTFVNVTGDLDLAVEELDAMGQQHQDAVRLDPLALRDHQTVVHGNEGLADAVLVQSQASSHQLDHRQQELDHHQSHETGEEDILAQSCRQYQQARSEDRHPGQDNHNNADDIGKIGMDIGQAAIGDPPGHKDHADQDQAGDPH